MLHISSQDFATGESYEGTWNLSDYVDSTLYLLHHYVDDAHPIPWAYPGADGFVIVPSDTMFQVTDIFPVMTTEKDDPVTITQMQGAIDFALMTAASAITINTFEYQAADDQFFIEFSAPVQFLWTNPGATAAQVFNLSADSGDVTDHEWPAVNADTRPPLLELEITESSTTGVGTGPTVADLFIPMFDFQLPNATVPLQSRHNSLGMRWSRTNARGVAVPMANEWHLIFNS